MPSQLGQLTKVVEGLRLSQNSLSSSLPTQLGAMSTLRDDCPVLQRVRARRMLGVCSPSPAAVSVCSRVEGRHAASTRDGAEWW